MEKNFTTLYQFILILLCLLCCSYLNAQIFTYGILTDKNGDPLEGANVVVKNTDIGTATNADGRFELELPSDSVIVQFRYIGLITKEQLIHTNSDFLTISLTDEAMPLEKVVVTGLATNTTRSQLPNAVETIEAAELTGTTSQPSMDVALYGKIKGAMMRANSGAPGGGMTVRLRGITSIFGNQQPLYIVDGTYIDNSAISPGNDVVSAAAGGGSPFTNQDDPSNRIADLDPEDIEKIEVLKGASAAAIYGSRAAGGVILITTKKGQPGETKIQLRQTFGQTSLLRSLGSRDWDAQKVATTFGEAEVQRYKNAIAQGRLYDYEKEVYGQKGLLTTTRLEVAGGTDRTSFFLAGTHKNNEGIVKNTGYQKTSVRANIDHNLTDWLDFSFSNNFIHTKADRGFFNNSNTNTTIGYALAFVKPWDELHADNNGRYPDIGIGSNPLQTIDLVTNNEKNNRYLGSLSMNLKLLTTKTTSLKIKARAGLDYYNLNTTGIFPKELVYFRDPATLNGVLIAGATNNTNTNLAAFLVHSWHPDTYQQFSFRTQIGVTQDNFNRNTIISTATGINGSQTNLGQSSNRDIDQWRQQQVDKGFFVQEEINWNDKMVLTVGLRGDKSSNNGDVNKLYYYPKAAFAVNLDKFNFLPTEQWQIHYLKLRTAYGQSGRFSNFGDKYTRLNGINQDGLGGWEANSLQGNSEVKPERQSELEAGLDIGFWKGRLAMDFTYYIKQIDDLLLNVTVPGSTGFTRQVRNDGQLQNKGFEIGIKANPIVKQDFNWITSTSFWLNRSQITQLGVPAFTLGGFGKGLGTYLIQEGASATQIGGAFSAEDCGTPDCSDLDPDGDGIAIFGDAEPDFNMAFSNQLNYKKWDFSFLWHWKKGGDAINLTRLLTDFGGISADYDDTTLDPAGQLTNGLYRLSQFPNNAAPFIENAGYLRLREVGLFYTIPKLKIKEIARIKVGLSGRNLINVFSYGSWDPEVSNFGSNVLANTVEVTPFPSAKQWFVHLNVSF